MTTLPINLSPSLPLSLSLKRKIILGTVQFGLDYGIHNKIGKMDKKSVHEVLHFAKSAGIETLDTADAYGDSQLKIGNFQKENLIFFKILTKFKSIPANSIIEHTRNTLETLGLSQLECVSLHDFNELSELKNYSKIKDAGLTKKIGISVYTPEECLIAMESSPIDVVQIPFNILDNENRWQNVFELKSKLRRKVEIHSRSCFLQGLFYKSFKQITEDTPYLIELIPYLTLIGMAAKDIHKSIAEYSLNYCIQNENIDRVLIGVNSLSQLKQNLACIQMPLPQSALDYVSQIRVKNLDLINPSQWPNLKKKNL